MATRLNSRPVGGNCVKKVGRNSRAAERFPLAA
jgi:hypothetical protein